LPGELRFAKTQLIELLGVGAAFSGQSATGQDFFLDLPNIPGVVIEIRRVVFRGTANSGNHMGFSHNLTSTNPGSNIDFFSDKDLWAIAGPSELVSGANGLGDFNFLEPYLLVGRQNWRGFNGGGGSAGDLWAGVYYTTQKMNLRLWTDLLTRTSFERD